MKVTILYGSATGNAEHIAKALGKSINESKECSSAFKSADIYELNMFKRKKLMESWIVKPPPTDDAADGDTSMKKHALILVTSTTGNGDAPENATRFVRYLKKAPPATLTSSCNDPTKPLEYLAYSVLALGDTNYDKFCETGKHLDKKLNDWGAERGMKLVCADEATGLEGSVEPWLKGVLGSLEKACLEDDDAAEDQKEEERKTQDEEDLAGEMQEKLAIPNDKAETKEEETPVSLEKASLLEESTSNATDTRSSKPQRVVSLLGASTETIYRLGLEGVLVGRSHECDYPPACLKLPCISRPRMDPEKMNSAEIDAAVRDFAARNEPVYKLQDETLMELKPDLLIAQDHCRVCAVTAKDIDSSACHKIPQLILRPADLNDCLADVTLVANALGYPERGQALRETLQERLDRVQKLGSSVQQPHASPRVALLEWCDPVMGCGYWLPELVTLAGGRPLFSTPPGGATPSLSFSDLIASKPDVVVLALCGFSISRTAQEILLSWRKDQIDQLRQECPNVFVADGNYLFNRSGPRVVESAEVILEALYKPHRGHFGHLGSHFLMTLEDALGLKETTGAFKSRPPVQEEKKEESDFGGMQEPIKLPSDMVGKQLACLRDNDMMGAFSWNSLANQRRWCEPGRFAHVLKTHGDFKRLLAEVPTLRDHNSRGLVEVELKGGPTLMWTCVVERNEDTTVWRTEKVGVQ